MSLVSDLSQSIHCNFASFEEEDVAAKIASLNVCQKVPTSNDSRGKITEVAKDAILQDLKAHFPQVLSQLIASHLQLEEEVSIDCIKTLQRNSKEEQGEQQTEEQSEQQLERVLERIKEEATYVKKLAFMTVGDALNTAFNMKNFVRLFETVSQHCTRLNELTIVGSFISASALQPIISCQKLHALNLRIGIFTSWGKHISIPEYRDQQEKTMTKDKQGEIGKLLTQFSQLTQLEAQGLIDSDIAIITDKLPLLTQLRLTNSSAMTKKSMKYIATLTHLAGFSFGSTEMETKHFSLLRPRAQTLQNLSLDKGEQLQRLGPLPQLQTLTLNVVTATDLDWILVNCPALKELHLKPYNNGDLIPSCLLKLRNHTQLQKIKVRSFHQLFRDELERLKPSFSAQCRLEIS